MNEIETIKKFGKKAQGGKELIAFLNGKRLTRNQAIKAKCYECMGYCSDGRQDCEQTDCPLYGFHPYAKS